jgi:membrane-associated protease RseP (regulator of RpoE activity)
MLQRERKNRMWNYIKIWLDSRLLGLVTRPLAALILASLAFGLVGLVGGIVYDVLHNSSGHAFVAGVRLASAGAAAGFVVGLMNALDRLTWPEDKPGESEKPILTLPRSKEVARFPRTKSVRGMWPSHSKYGAHA